MKKQNSVIIFLGIILFSGYWIMYSNGTTPQDPNQKPADFVAVNKVIPSLIFDVRYFSDNNFLGVKVSGYQKGLCLLTKPASEALKRVQKTLLEKGLTLKIFDCYRPQRAVDHFVKWAGDTKDTKMKALYYPNEDKVTLIEKGYIASQSGHSRGSTLDLTLAQVSNHRELDMGTPYDYFDVLSHTNTTNSKITKEQRENRQLLKSSMEAQGFINFEKEWWHYTLKNEPYPDTYFDFLVE